MINLPSFLNRRSSRRRPPSIFSGAPSMWIHQQQHQEQHQQQLGHVEQHRQQRQQHHKHLRWRRQKREIHKGRKGSSPCFSGISVPREMSVSIELIDHSLSFTNDASHFHRELETNPNSFNRMNTSSNSNSKSKYENTHKNSDKKKQVRFLLDAQQQVVTTVFSYTAAMSRKRSCSSMSSPEEHQQHRQHKSQDVYWTAPELHQCRMEAKDCIRHYAQQYPSHWEYLLSLERFYQHSLPLRSTPTGTLDDKDEAAVTTLSEQAMLTFLQQTAQRGLEVHVTRLFQHRRKATIRRVLWWQEHFRRCNHDTQRHLQKCGGASSEQDAPKQVEEQDAKTDDSPSPEATELLRFISCTTSAASSRFAYQLAQVDWQHASDVYHHEESPL